MITGRGAPRSSRTGASGVRAPAARTTWCSSEPHAVVTQPPGRGSRTASPAVRTSAGLPMGAELDTYAGAYEQDLFGRFEVIVDGELALNPLYADAIEESQ